MKVFTVSHLLHRHRAVIPGQNQILVSKTRRSKLKPSIKLCVLYILVTIRVSKKKVIAMIYLVFFVNGQNIHIK